jgi:outer membrane protein
MKKSLLTLMLSLAGLASADAMAQESPFLVRARAVYINPADQSAPVSGTGAADRIHVGTKTIPELDVSY